MRIVWGGKRIKPMVFGPRALWAFGPTRAQALGDWRFSGSGRIIREAMKKPALTLCILLAAAPAFAGDGHDHGGFSEGMTQNDVQDFYQKNPEIHKKQKDYADKLKRQAETGQVEGDQRADNAPLDDEIQGRIAALAGADPRSYMQDIIAEAEEEKAQLVEENIWSMAERKATPELRQLYRDYLRRVYFHGSAKDGDAAKHIAYIRRGLETPGGDNSFPTAHFGTVPEGVAATWSGGDITMKTGLLDMVVFSHEWFHHTDNVNSGIDGESMPGPEPHAYDKMGSDI